jgi:outer membrane beta-barrel protein
MKRFDWFVDVLSKLSIILASVVSTTSVSQSMDLDPNEIRGTSSKKPVAVLQNRFFLKALRPEFGILYGSILNESYTKTTLIGVRTGMFLNEWVGAEAQFIKAGVQDSDDRKALNELRYRKFDDPDKTVTPDPEVNRISGITEVSAIAAPFYGKLSLLDWTIIYTDLYGTLGLSRVSTDQGSKSAISFGGGIRTYWASNWSTRLDFRDRTYTEIRGGQETRKHAWAVDFGLSYLLF